MKYKKKTTKLSLEEFEIMKTHTTKGGKIIQDEKSKSFDPLIVDVFLENREQIEEIYCFKVE